MSKREFLHLAHDFEFGKHCIGGWYVSEKLDGIRAFWDGGITRGMPCSEVPFANTTKHARFKVAPIATGLWTRYGQPFRAPKWFLDSLPPIPLDGELTMGRGSWQQVSSCVKAHDPIDFLWRKVQYAVFDCPSFGEVFKDGKINNSNFKKIFSGVYEWACAKTEIRLGSGGLFTEILKSLTRFSKTGGLGEFAYLVPQAQLSSSYSEAEKQLKITLAEVESLGGEGLVIRSPISIWKPERSWGMLKVKSSKDDEAMVVGFRFGKPTDVERSVTGEATDKLLGLMGSLRVRMKSGIEFDLPGFTESERQIQTDQGTSDAATSYAVSHPGELAPDWIVNPTFPRGETVSFRYRELSDSGVPKEPRYYRKRSIDV